MTFEFKPEVNHPEAVHISLDLETASTATNAAILQIGAVCIAEPHKYFNQYISLTDSERIGLDVSVATMEWWSKQDQVLRERVFNNPEASLHYEAMDKFVEWCEDLCNGDLKRIYLWSKGADFDLPILKSSLEVYGEYPFEFRNHRCYRTEVSAMSRATQERAAGKFLQENPNFQSHDALWDARMQGAILKNWII